LRILIAGNGDVGNLHYYFGKFEAYQRTYVLSDFVTPVQYVWQQLDYRLAGSLGLGKIGTSIPYIKKENLTGFPFPVPPTTSEQSAIATALGDVDALLAAQDALIAKKRAIKQGAMQELLTGKRRLPGFSGEWEVKPSAQIGYFRGGTGFPLSSQGGQGGEYPFFKVSDMNNDGNKIFMENANNWISDPTRKQLGATAFPAGSIVFAKVGAAIFLERKKILSRPSCIDNNMAAFVIDENQADISFIHLQLLNVKFGALVATTALPALNGKVLSEMLLTLPPTKEEQTAIAEVLTDIDTQLTALETQRTKTAQLKQGMMQALLTGRIRLI
jgi:type I restriction enzyme S subunit